MSLTTGDRLGPYEIIAPLGAGGMGEVYRAADTRLKREVALKLLPDLFAGDPQRLARFTREAQALAALNHPNIAQIYGLEESGGVRALVMELVEGEDLSARMARGPLPLAEVLPIARQIAEALAAAHEQGIIHRDLKPANIKLRPDGTVKVLDFGLAKAIEPAGGSGGWSADSMSSPTLTGHATHMGMVLGTAAYMSPEQAKGMAVDKRADIWAFGVVLHEMLTGRLLFAGDSVGDTLAAVIRAEIDFDSLPAATPPTLRRVLHRCLERNRKNRLHDIADARLEIEDLILGRAEEGPDVSAPAAPRRWKRMTLAGAVAVAALAAGVALGRFWPRSTPAGAAASQVSFERLTFRQGHFTNARFAPDGQTIFLSAAWEGRPREVLQVRPKAGELAVGLKGAELLSVSRTGELALLLPRVETGNPYSKIGTLAVVSASGGTPRELAENVVGADWAPDGKSLAVERNTGGRWQLEYPLGKTIYESPTQFNWIRVSPDGESVAFFDRDGLSWSVVLVMRSGEKRVLSRDWSDWWNLAWSPDGQEIWFGAARVVSAASLYAVDLSGRLRVLLAAPGTLELHDIAPDGTLAAAQVYQTDHIFGARSTDATERDLAWLEDSRVVDLSLDGKQVLMRVVSEQDPAPAVFMRTMDGAPPVRLGPGTAQEFSRDGKWALAIRENAVVALPTGAGQEKVLQTDLAALSAARFLPDADRVLIAGRASDGRVLAKVTSFSGGAERTVSESFDLRLIQVYIWPLSSVSPDGRHVAAAMASGAISLWPLDGGPARTLPGSGPNDVPIQWTPDGTGLFVYDISELPTRIDQVDLASGRRTAWRTIAPIDRAGVYGIPRIVMTPDRSAYAYYYFQFRSSLYLVKGLR